MSHCQDPILTTRAEWHLDTGRFLRDDARMGCTMKLSQGQRIRLARESAGMEQADLAEHVRVARATISSWEIGSNKRPVAYAYLRIIAEATGVSLDWLEGGDHYVKLIGDEEATAMATRRYLLTGRSAA